MSGISALMLRRMTLTVPLEPPVASTICWCATPPRMSCRTRSRFSSMDFLEANKDAIEKAIYFRMADLLNLDVEIVFYDTTSLHFEADEEDRGFGERDEVHGSLAAGRKISRARRKRGHAKNGRFDAPQIVVGLAVTRDGLPVRHWIFPGNTVDVTTVERVKKDLQGWQLSRCVFVCDAGVC